MNNEPLRLLAFVRPELDQGPILAAEGDWANMLREVGSWDIGDYSMRMPDRPGLHIFEGWTKLMPDDPSDMQWEGEWRQLTHWEMCRLRFGMVPW